MGQIAPDANLWPHVDIVQGIKHVKWARGQHVLHISHASHGISFNNSPLIGTFPLMYVQFCFLIPGSGIILFNNRVCKLKYIK